MMRNRRHFIYPDSDSLVAAFACEVSNFIEHSTHSEQPVNIALSGGSTPLHIFDHLATTPGKERWKNIQLFWSDERMVPPESDQSNYGNAKRRLIDPLDLDPGQVHRIRGEGDPEEEAARYGEELNQKLPRISGIPVFDWIWLGLGEDGHMASIFPGQLDLMNSDRPCEVSVQPGSGNKRVTLTGPVINWARRITFLVTGARKSQVINEIVMKEGRFQEYPAHYVNPMNGLLEWYMDKEATEWL